MGWLSQTSGQIRDLWTGRGRSQQIGLLVLAAVAVAMVVMLLRFSSNTSYVTAFTNLDPKDASAATAELQAQHILYQLADGGETIKVPPDQVANAKLKLAAKGLPQGGSVGFELFDKTSFGVTDFVQNVNYQRALEGELTRTIEALDAVQTAKVNIVVPPQELFTTQQKPATASVLLTIRPGRTLDSSALAGIAHLVSKSVQGLDEQNIAIVDSSGRTLFDGTTAAGSSGSSTAQQDVENHVEMQLEDELQTLLDRVAGPNRSAVRVKADLDFSQGQTTTESYTPGGANGQGVPISNSTVQETYNGAPLPAGQVPGASANIPGLAAAPGATPGAASGYQHTETTTNFDVSKSTSTTTQVPGGIKRLYISVILDSSISDQDAAGLKDAVATAAGFNAARGDQITVATASFGNSASAPTVLRHPGPLDSLSAYGKYVVPALVALIVLFVLWRMSRSAAPAAPRLSVVSSVPALPPPGGVFINSQDFENEPVIEPPVRGMAALAPEQRQQVRERVAALADDDPEALATLIRSWMTERSPGSGTY